MSLLSERWAGRESFAILATGIGCATDFLATWQAWRDDAQRPQRLHYFALIKQPPIRDELAAPGATPESFAAQLRAAWPSQIGGFHRLHFEGGRVSLTLVSGEPRTMISRIEGRFDAFAIALADATPEFTEELAWLAAENAICIDVTGHGHSITPAEGASAVQPVPVPTASRRAAIIGAGIAGINCAERLAQRGWQVTLFDRNVAPAKETSGNRQAVLLPALAAEETRLSRLNRVAFLYVLRQLATLAEADHPVTWSGCGVFQISRHAEHARKQQAIVANQNLPVEFVQYLNAAAASQLAGTPVSDGGWWFPQGGWLAPESLCRSLLAAAGTNLGFRPATTISAVTPTALGWQLRDAAGKALWEGPTVILAHAHGLRELAQSAHLPLRCFRGQVSHLPASNATDLPRCVVCREGYIAPAHEGIAGLGATFQRSHDTRLQVEDHLANLTKLGAMLPALADRFVAEKLSGRVGLRPVSPDKLPMVGALPLASCEPRPAAHVEWPRWPGLYVASGYGARGFVWAPLMAELLACQINGEPLPIETELAAAVDPARFPWKGTL